MTTRPRQLKRVFCLGLGGVGVSAVARLLLAEGVSVTGTDPQHQPVVDDVIAAGGIWYPQEHPQYLTKDFDLVVYTDDANEQHPIRRRAQALGIPAENFSVTLARMIANRSPRIAIAGTNGKSTTTALTGLLMTDAGVDPTVFVGSRVTEFNGNVRFGQGSSCIFEADEYKDHYLNFAPTITVLTNVEPDHLDYFQTVERMEVSFAKFLSRLPTDGVAVVNADDAVAMRLSKHAPRTVSFGFSAAADLRADHLVTAAGQQQWTTFWLGKSLGLMTLHLPGTFNVMNTLAAIAATLVAGASARHFSATITRFQGIWRRFQILNPGASTTIVSDYAHHPTAVAATIMGAKAFYPGRRLVAVFQPHHRSRLTALFQDFTKCFTGADEVVLVEAYSVPGRDIPESASRTTLELATATRINGLTTTYVVNPEAATDYLRTTIQPGDIVLIMGAGDIWRSAEQLASFYV